MGNIWKNMIEHLQERHIYICKYIYKYTHNIIYIHSYTHFRSQKWVVSPWLFWYLNSVIPGKTHSMELQHAMAMMGTWGFLMGKWWEHEENLCKMMGKCGKNTANHEHLCKSPIINGGCNGMGRNTSNSMAGKKIRCRPELPRISTRLTSATYRKNFRFFPTLRCGHKKATKSWSSMEKSSNISKMGEIHVIHRNSEVNKTPSISHFFNMTNSQSFLGDFVRHQPILWHRWPDNLLASSCLATKST